MESTAITTTPTDAVSTTTTGTAALVHRLLPWILGALLAVAVASTFGPWIRTGAARRSSYEAVRSAARLDVVEGSGADLVRVLWPFVPFVACLALLALVLDLVRTGAALSAVVGLAVVTFAVLVSRVPDLADWGVTAGLVSGAALLAGSLLVLTLPRPLPPTGAPHDDT